MHSKKMCVHFEWIREPNNWEEVAKNILKYEAMNELL